MKKIKFAFCIIFSVLIANAQNGASMNFKYSSSKGITGNMIINTSDYGAKTVIKMGSAKGGNMMNMTSLLLKEKPDVIYVLNEASKSYSEMKKGTAATAEDKSTYSVKKLGNETINGYKCVHALVTESNGTTEVWNTKDITEYNKYAEAISTNKEMASSKRDKALKDAGCEGFPVKMIRKSNKEDGDVTMELVNLEKKTFSKSDFEIPAGYTKSASPAMPSGMPQMKTQQEIMNMTPAEREKYVEEMKKMYGGGK